MDHELTYKTQNYETFRKKKLTEGTWGDLGKQSCQTIKS